MPLRFSEVILIMEIRFISNDKLAKIAIFRVLKAFDSISPRRNTDLYTCIYTTFFIFVHVSSISYNIKYKRTYVPRLVCEDPFENGEKSLYDFEGTPRACSRSYDYLSITRNNFPVDVCSFTYIYIRISIYIYIHTHTNI